MALTWVICAGSTARLREVPALLLLPGAEEPGGLLKYQRMAKKPTRATARSCGMLIEVSVWAMLAVVCETFLWECFLRRLLVSRSNEVRSVGAESEY